MMKVLLVMLALAAGAVLWAACMHQAGEYGAPAPLRTSEAHEQGVFHYERGYERLRQADYDNAVADMDRARKLIDPELVHLYADSMREVYFQSGVAYYDTGLYDRAIILFDKAVDVSTSPSDYPATYYQRGYAYYRKGNYPRAIADYDEAIRLDPNNASAYELRAQAYEQLGDSAKAAQDWKKARGLSGE